MRKADLFDVFLTTGHYPEGLVSPTGVEVQLGEKEARVVAKALRDRSSAQYDTWYKVVPITRAIPKKVVRKDRLQLAQRIAMEMNTMLSRFKDPDVMYVSKRIVNILNAQSVAIAILTCQDGGDVPESIIEEVLNG